MARVAIIGNTTWGKSLAVLLCGKGMRVRIWARSDVEVEALNSDSASYLSTSKLEEAVDSADLVVWAVPSQKMRQNVVVARDYLDGTMLLLSVAKGLEVDTGKRMSQVIAEEISHELGERICVLSGPNLAKEIAQGLPAASLIASRDISAAERVREIMECASFRLFTSKDVVGTELCGALKNIVALGAGMIDGLDLGDNAKAAFITYAWNEIVSLGVSLGSDEHTFYGLAGLGDLITTCAGNLSRNHYFGYELGRGHSLSEVKNSMVQIVEGIYTSEALHRLTQRLQVKLPIADVIYDILFRGLPVGGIKTVITGSATMPTAFR